MADDSAAAAGTEEPATCVVCWAAPREVLLTACGHAVLCGECVRRVCASRRARCPLCSTPIPDAAWRALGDDGVAAAAAPSYRPTLVEPAAAAAADALRQDAETVDAAAAARGGGDGAEAFLVEAFMNMVRGADGAHSGMLLHLAALDDSCAEAAALLLSLGADVGSRREDGATPLHTAARAGSALVLQALLASGATLTATDHEGATPLHGCADAAVARLLLAAGADANARAERGVTPLHAAAMRGSADVLLALLTHGGADATLAAEDGRLALHFAADADDAASVEYLLSRDRGSACARDASGHTPLHFAARAGSVGGAAALLGAGAAVDARTECGMTPLHFAAQGAPGGHDCAALLLAHCAAVGAADAFGWTPLHTAAGCDAQAIVRLLLSRGADAGARTHEGEVPRQLARQRATRCLLRGYRKSIGAALRERIADVAPSTWMRAAVYAVLAGDILARLAAGARTRRAEDARASTAARDAALPALAPADVDAAAAAAAVGELAEA
jgi:cytohesin